jgi:hypothetical protein
MEKFPGEEVGLIPTSVGGTAIAAWMPGGKDTHSERHPYDDALEMARFAMQSGKVEVILWHQGESDVVGKTENYKEKLIEVINNLRRELDLQDVPVILGGLGTFLNPNRFAARDEYDALIQQAAAELPNAGFAVKPKMVKLAVTVRTPESLGGTDSNSTDTSDVDLSFSRVIFAE